MLNMENVLLDFASPLLLQDTSDDSYCGKLNNLTLIKSYVYLLFTCMSNIIYFLFSKFYRKTSSKILTTNKLIPLPDPSPFLIRINLIF